MGRRGEGRGGERARRVLVGVVVSALVTAGAAGASCRERERGSEATVPSTSAPEPSSTTELANAPLTGVPVDDEEVLDRPAVIVKVDNDPKARPQAGLDKADVVVEERVEGSVVRFLAIFQSRDAKMVGPIRSLRSTDPPIVAAIGGVFAYSGGIAAFESQLKRTGVKVLTERTDEDAFILRDGRQRPYKTFADTADLRGKAPDGAAAPPPLFARIQPGAGFGEGRSTPATKATVVFGSRTTAVWDYDGVTGRWKRTTNGTAHKVEGGSQLSFTTVILQRVAYRDTGFTDRTSAQVDEAVVVGKGEAVILAQGRQVKARWSKPSLKAVTTYTDAATGQPIAVPPGTTWVSLVPSDAPITIAPSAARQSTTTSTTARRR